MAHEEFLAQPGVDVKPYTPHNWHPEYAYNRLEDGLEVNGFVQDTVVAVDRLIYRYRRGVGDTATCRLIPETNLEWNNYEFGGKMLKFSNPQQDTIEVGITVYDNGGEDRYLITFKNDGIYLEGGGLSSQKKSDTTFSAGDSIAFRVQVTTNVDAETADTTVDIRAYMRRNDGAEEKMIDTTDATPSGTTSGQPGLWIDLSRLDGDRTSMGKTKVGEAYVKKLE